ncbi:unknown [Bacteroides sp. CAG:754]|nr:unknown [Bacteroides sp. CAG:754]
MFQFQLLISNDIVCFTVIVVIIAIRTINYNSINSASVHLGAHPSIQLRFQFFINTLDYCFGVFITVTNRPSYPNRIFRNPVSLAFKSYILYIFLYLIFPKYGLLLIRVVRTEAIACPSLLHSQTVGSFRPNGIDKTSFSKFILKTSRGISIKELSSQCFDRFVISPANNSQALTKTNGFIPLFRIFIIRIFQKSGKQAFAQQFYLRLGLQKFFQFF